MTETPTVACVLRTGGIYNEAWVDRLARGVARNLDEHRFVCITDGNPDCETIPFVHAWPKWWGKIELFRKGIFSGRVLYLDLDTVVVGSLREIVAHPHHFTMAHDFYKPAWFCSTAMAWDADHDFRLYEHFCKSAPHSMRVYNGARGQKLGDQGFIQDWLVHKKEPIATFASLFGSQSVASFKVDKCHDKPPTNASVVAFHGRPKPSEITSGWVAEQWRM